MRSKSFLNWASPYRPTMTADEPSSTDDPDAGEPDTIDDVDHAHPETGETFDRTGVHARGQKQPHDQAADSTDESEDTS